MNWNSARALARSGLHVRREAWPAGCWLIYQRGIAWFWDAAAWRIVHSADFAVFLVTTILCALGALMLPLAG